MKLNLKLGKFITIALCLTFFTASHRKDYNTVLQIKHSQNGKIDSFLISIAKTEDKKAKGLMFVDNFPNNRGMLFEFKEEQIVNMWMKDTLIPLDMLFIDKDKKIVNIKHEAQIKSLEIISSIQPVTKVLEINGGLAKKLEIAVGDQIEYIEE
jgi:hypothetical protein